MIKEYIDSAGTAINILDTVSEFVKSKYKKKVLNIYGSYETFKNDTDINNIKFVCETFAKYINANLNKYYLEGRITIYRLCKNYINNFLNILKTRKDLGIKNRIILSWHKANYKTHRTIYFCNIESYLRYKEKYDKAIELKMKTNVINTLRLVRFIDIIPENYYKSKNVIDRLKPQSKKRYKTQKYENTI